MSETRKNNEMVQDKPQYSRSTNFRHEDFREYYEMYFIAKDMNNAAMMRNYANLIHEFIERYVYHYLWNNYHSLMAGPLRDDLLQHVFLTIYSKLFSDSEKNRFDPDKATITIYLKPWVKHGVQEFAASNIHNTTTHYSSAIKKVSACIEACHQMGIDPTFDNIVKITGLPPTTCEEALKLIHRSKTSSIESLAENGYEKQASSLSPEDHVIRLEESEVFADFARRKLDEEEILVLNILVNPENSEKEKSSFREISIRMTEMGYDYNIPKVKSMISCVTQKIMKDKEMKKMFGHYFPQKNKNKANITDDKDLIDESLADFKREFSGEN